ncbi:hypothetical protein BRI6_4532 [plant metagenome]|uniref:Uncharacterized protein n=1 Tax=plant metagenome TaxID=1297885 RepID=A0A484YXA0_9ZZZZ
MQSNGMNAQGIGRAHHLGGGVRMVRVVNPDEFGSICRQPLNDGAADSP